MDQGTTDAIRFPEDSSQDVLTGILREGAQRLLAQAIEAEVAGYIEAHGDLRDAQGHRLVVRNGRKDERELQTGVGPVKVRQPRVDDRRIDEHGERMRFTSSILPPYLRRTKSIEELIPWLYLKGISTGDFSCHRSVQNQPPMIESKPASEVAFLILHSLPSSQDFFGLWGGLLFLGSLGFEAALFRRR